MLSRSIHCSRMSSISKFERSWVRGGAWRPRRPRVDHGSGGELSSGCSRPESSIKRTRAVRVSLSYISYVTRSNTLTLFCTRYRLSRSPGRPRPNPYFVIYCCLAFFRLVRTALLDPLSAISPLSLSEPLCNAIYSGRYCLKIISFGSRPAKPASTSSAWVLRKKMTSSFHANPPSRS